MKNIEYRVTFADGKPGEWLPIPAEPYLMLPTSPATPPQYMVAKIEFRDAPAEQPAEPVAAEQPASTPCPHDCPYRMWYQ
jgi:hypothetical protein